MNLLSKLRQRARSESPAASLGLALSYPVLVVAAVLPNAWVFTVAAAVGYICEAVLDRRGGGYLFTGLQQVGLGLTLRFVVREAALLVLMARESALAHRWYVTLAAALVLAHLVRAVHSQLAVQVLERRRLPALARGLDLSRLRIPPPPPRTLTSQHTRSLLHLDLPLVAGALLCIPLHDSGTLLDGIIVAAAAGLVALLVTGRQAARNRRLADADETLRIVGEEVAAYRPEVLLYFSGGADTVYQVNMWLETLDRLEQRTMVLMRERGNMPLLGRTSSPVLCLPGGTEMMNFPIPDSVRVGLFPANAGKNIHLLRLAEVRTVFVGHGDSDKAASFNPFSKVYDEVWVAGPAGRERYLRSDAGVLDADIVEVGRPQLAAITTGTATGTEATGPLTVLYAPTWEGWTGDKYHTSVAVMGPAIAAALLARPDVRLLYKPHPMAGKDQAAVRNAHEKIVKMIEAANAGRPAGDDAATARLAELTARLAELEADSEVWDEAETTRVAAADTTGDVEHRRVVAECEQAYWAAAGPVRHQVVTGAVPHLYSCFNQADVMITDISSVVADFIASGKPYVVTNGANLPESEFMAANPSASAGYLLSRDCRELADILELIIDPADDPLAGRRAELKHELLGPDTPDAMTRFAQAVDALMKKE